MRDGLQGETVGYFVYNGAGDGRMFGSGDEKQVLGEAHVENIPMRFFGLHCEAHLTFHGVLNKRRKAGEILGLFVVQQQTNDVMTAATLTSDQRNSDSGSGNSASGTASQAMQGG